MNGILGGEFVWRRRWWIVAVVTSVLLALLMPMAAHPANAASSPPLGVPYAATLVVPNLNAAKAQLSAATGIAWQAETQLSVNAKLNGGPDKKQKVTLKRVFSKSAQPFVELVQAVPASGQSLAGTPWETGFAKGYMTYRAKNAKQSAQALEDAGMTLIAESGNKFAIYEGINGVRVQVVDESLAPATGQSYTSQAPLNFGAVNHVGYQVNGSSTITAVTSQLASALGTSWEPVNSFPAQLNFPPNGLQDVVTDNSFTTVGSPFIEIGSTTPALHPFDSTATFAPIHIAYAINSADMAAARMQLEAAGFTLAAGLDFPGLEVLGHYESASSGIDVEILNNIFAHQP